MTLVLVCEGIDCGKWRRHLADALPGREIRVWPDSGPPEAVRYALAWHPPRGVLRRFPNLAAIFSLGAGIEHLRADPELPEHVAVVRMVDPGLTAGMVEFVLARTLHYHRRLHDYAALQAAAEWRELDQPMAEDRGVGVLGLGALGAAAAGALAALGFDVAGWSRTPRTLPGVICHHGSDGLAAVLRRSEILVCLLPLTPETEGVLNAATLALLPAGACVINAGRGGHMVDSDLLALLESGHLAAATLDVFRTEPLPPDHPYWRHPKVTVLPHVAAITQPSTASRTIAANITRIERGEPPEGMVDGSRGY